MDCTLFRTTLRRRSSRGFTLLETVVAAAAVSIFAMGAVLALTQVNRFATQARLRTIAVGLAQQRIDEILTTSWQTTLPRPSVLASGTQTETTMVLGGDALNAQAGLSSIVTGQSAPIAAQRTTVVTDLGARRLRAVCTVAFTFRGVTYQPISLTTLRTADNL